MGEMVGVISPGHSTTSYEPMGETASITPYLQYEMDGWEKHCKQGSQN